MPPISPQLHEELGKRLHKSRDDVLATVRARTAGDTDDRPAIAPNAHMGQNDDAPAGEMLSHNEEHLAEHETNLLHEIDAAIGRLDSGAIGICESCGREIPEARLLATPTVRTCIACQERIEHDQRTGRGPSM
ncbi:TraR/DksA family transcriptional regulator [Massilia pinisoli]|jgi:RNA polymerase-binding transcription factor DksA|uniref:TraR/DksA family transcriptional regulator n=1 Tax=Massilia pinisoli TaxID=1772194 RepID=A0ABT1ZLA1_9BURK|nr:TraR/DksA family transcriptional regulator [Massilia pinisoli]MCS0580519.1 TraR/DksA family transcriptional regulator [Massilia pinisoli]